MTSLPTAKLEEILGRNGGRLGLPKPGDKQWGASFTKWLQLGLTLDFIENVATNLEDQEWSATTKTKAKYLNWEFHQETQWRRKMENIYQAVGHSIIFGELGSHGWEVIVVKCYELGLNVGFVEEIEQRQKPLQSWTAKNRDRAKLLEWEFHRPVLTAKYVGGKSTAVVVKEVLEEKGVKLPSETLNKRLTEWGVPKRTKPRSHCGTPGAEINTPAPSPTKLSPATTDGYFFPSQHYASSELLPPRLSLLPLNSNPSSNILTQRGQQAHANIPDFMDGVEYAAISGHMASGMSMGGNQGMTQGWKDKQIVQQGRYDNSNSSAQGFTYSDYPDPDQAETEAETRTSMTSNASSGFHSYMNSSQISRISPSHLASSAHGSLTRATSIPDTNTWLPLTSNLTTANFQDDSGSQGNRQRELSARPFSGAQDIETQVRDLTAAIRAKEEELKAIDGNRNGIAAELDELKTQPKQLSFDPMHLVVGCNPPSSHSPWSLSPRKDFGIARQLAPFELEISHTRSRSLLNL